MVYRWARRGSRASLYYCYAHYLFIYLPVYLSPVLAGIAPLLVCLSIYLSDKDVVKMCFVLMFMSSEVESKQRGNGCVPADDTVSSLQQLTVLNVYLHYNT